MEATDAPAARSRPVEVLGRDTCEDTAITRSRLAALGVPFTYRDADADPGTAARLRAIHDGSLVTPTVLVDGEVVATEPSVDRVDALAAEAGHAASPPAATQLHPPHTEAAVPLARVPAGLIDTPGRNRWTPRQLAVLLPHAADCLACFGYGRQLAGRSDELAEVDTDVAIVVPGHGEPHHWRRAELPGATLLRDGPGAWRAELAERLPVPADGALVLVLDRFLAPRAFSAADDAGGLIAPAEVVAWHALVVLDCPECSGELPWPAPAGPGLPDGTGGT
jgi:hypothetical protein